MNNAHGVLSSIARRKKSKLEASTFGTALVVQEGRDFQGIINKKAKNKNKDRKPQLSMRSLFIYLNISMDV